MDVTAEAGWCRACGIHRVLGDDATIFGALNLIYHIICPICADEMEDPMQIIWEFKPKEVIGDAT